MDKIALKNSILSLVKSSPLVFFIFAANRYIFFHHGQ